MISYQEANNIILKEFSSFKSQTKEVDLLDSLNYVLAEDIHSDINFPAFDNSAMDGFAIIYSEKVKEWQSIGEISAGNYKEFNLTETATVQIMTGGKIPGNCTAVIPVEDVVIEGNSIKLKEDAKLKEGQNIRILGEDLLSGNIVLEKNTVMNPQIISAAAACGKSKINVYEKLKIGVLATGDELIDINEIPTGDKIRATNLYSLLSAINQINMTPVNLGFANDEKENLESKIKSALESDINILLTTGGVSVGKYDFVKEIFESLSVQIKFWKVNIKPGKPLLFGMYHKDDNPVFVFGLPGNPVSSLVNFKIFVEKNINKLFSIEQGDTLKAILLSDISKRDSKRHFVRGRYKYDISQGKHAVEKVGSQSSGNLVGMSKANCLIIFEEEKRNLEKGEVIECIMI